MRVHPRGEFQREQVRREQRLGLVLMAVGGVSAGAVAWVATHVQGEPPTLDLAVLIVGSMLACALPAGLVLYPWDRKHEDLSGHSPPDQD